MRRGFLTRQIAFSARSIGQHHRQRADEQRDQADQAEPARAQRELRDRAEHRLGDRVGNERLQEIALQRVLQRREHRKRREQRQHHRDQRHQRDDRGERQAAGGEREAILAEAPASVLAVVSQGHACTAAIHRSAASGSVTGRSCNALLAS
jgi:hypothetical protein